MKEKDIIFVNSATASGHHIFLIDWEDSLSQHLVLASKGLTCAVHLCDREGLMQQSKFFKSAAKEQENKSVKSDLLTIQVEWVNTKWLPTCFFFFIYHLGNCMCSECGLFTGPLTVSERARSQLGLFGQQDFRHPVTHGLSSETKSSTFCSIMWISGCLHDCWHRRMQ